MKKILFGILAVSIIAGLTACGQKTNPSNEPEESTSMIENTPNAIVEENKKLSNEEMYGKLVADYQTAVANYDLEDVDREVDPRLNESLLMHLARYAQDGVTLTTSYIDIDKNGTNELLVGADNGLGAIYAYDENKKEPVKIIYQSTLERGNMSVYRNGIILTEGAGGAALHYYEIGRIGTDGKSYQVLESIIEEYIEGSDVPVYTNYENEEKLDYQSIDEILNKYVSGVETYSFGETTTSNTDVTNSVQEAIVGEWKKESLGMNFIYIFNADGTGKYDAAGSLMPFTYKTQDNHISILYEGNDSAVDTTYSIEGDVLNMLDSFGEDTLYQKVK